jgi:hypothetical protein
MELLRRGSRLSVQSVSADQFRRILALAKRRSGIRKNSVAPRIRNNPAEPQDRP